MSNVPNYLIDNILLTYRQNHQSSWKSKTYSVTSIITKTGYRFLHDRCQNHTHEATKIDREIEYREEMNQQLLLIRQIELFSSKCSDARLNTSSAYCYENQSDNGKCSAKRSVKHKVSGKCLETSGLQLNYTLDYNMTLTKVSLVFLFYSMTQIDFQWLHTDFFTDE